MPIVSSVPVQLRKGKLVCSLELKSGFAYIFDALEHNVFMVNGQAVGHRLPGIGWA